MTKHIIKQNIKFMFCFLKAKSELFIPGNVNERPASTKVSIHLYLDIFANFSHFFSVLLLLSMFIFIIQIQMK